MNTETFESAYVNGEFSPLAAMKSMDREIYAHKRDLEKVRRKLARLRLRAEELASENVRLREIIEDLTKGGE